MKFYLSCIECGSTYSTEDIRFFCECGGLLDIEPDKDEWEEVYGSKNYFQLIDYRSSRHNSGVWRYKDFVGINARKREIITRNEGSTGIYMVRQISEWTGVESLEIKHEGENPTGSFKDRGMTVAMTRALQHGVKVVACASTGNTSASMASYASTAGLRSIVLIPVGSVSGNKLSQAVAYGAKTVEIEGDFDKGMKLVLDCAREGRLYPMNSVNPYRIEGQKTIIMELLHQRKWMPPDWIIFPAGNLGNYSSFGKAIEELYRNNMIMKKPRLAGVQAEGANPFYLGFKDKFNKKYTVDADTIATAIRIGNPVNLPRAVRAIKHTDGIVTQVNDQEIMDAKAVVDRSGIGAEPASCASIAGLKKLVSEGVVKKNESVVAILTGHLLKDTDSVIAYHKGTIKGIKPVYTNKPVRIKPEMKELDKLIENLEQAE
ncbi:threonine synthase [candidate division KSB1 bacterium]